MRRLSQTVRCLGFAALAILLGAAAPTTKQPPANPVGAGWETKSTPAPNPDGIALDPTQTAAIAKVNAYFNSTPYLQGRFVQTDPDKVVSKGKIFLSRPGKFRFEYSPHRPPAPVGLQLRDRELDSPGRLRFGDGRIDREGRQGLRGELPSDALRSGPRRPDHGADLSGRDDLRSLEGRPVAFAFGMDEL